MTGSNLSRIEFMFFLKRFFRYSYLLFIANCLACKVKNSNLFSHTIICLSNLSRIVSRIYTRYATLYIFDAWRQRFIALDSTPRYLAEPSPFRNLRKATYSRVAASCNWRKESELDKPRGASGWDLALPLTPLPSRVVLRSVLQTN